MNLLQQMRDDNLAFQTNMAVQMNTQMNAQLAPIFTQIDFLTQHVENAHSTSLPPGVENQDIFTEGSGSEGSEMETQTDGGFAPGRGNKTKTRQTKVAPESGAIHSNRLLKKDGV